MIYIGNEIELFNIRQFCQTSEFQIYIRIINQEIAIKLLIPQYTIDINVRIGIPLVLML